MPDSDELNLNTLISKHKLDAHRELIQQNTKKGISLEPAPKGGVPHSDNSIPVGASKLGGLPDLPVDTEWPFNKSDPLQFILQVNLAELSESPLPKKGLLSFFYGDQVWGMSEEDKQGYRVLYFDSGATLQRKSAPQRPDKKQFFGLFKTSQHLKIYKPCLLEAKPFLCLPNNIGFEKDDDKTWDSYFEMLHELGGRTRLLGYPEPIQGEMEIECLLQERGLSWKDYERLTKEEKSQLDREAKEWNLLLQVDSDSENSDMMWGDAGMLYFFLKEADFKNGDFEKTLMIMQCY